MTERDKANIFDIVIKPFLCSDANNASQGTENLFAEAIRTLINTALLAQRDAHLECEQYERSADRNGQRNGLNIAPLGRKRERLLSMCRKCVILKRHSSRLFLDLNRGRELTEHTILP